MTRFVKIFLFTLILQIVHLTSVVAQQKDNLSEESRIEFDRNYINGTKEKMLQNLDAAKTHFDKCMDLDASNAAVHFQLSDIAYLNRKFKAAELHAKQAIKLDAKNVWYYKMLADIYEAQRDLTNAAAVYVQLSTFETETAHLMKAAYYYSASKSYSKALQLLDRVEKKNGVSEEIALQKEQIFLAQNQYKKAVKEIQKLVNAFPNVMRYKGMLAELYLANRDRDKALTLLNEILAKEPENGFAAFTLSDYYRTANDKEKFYQYLKLGIQSSDVSVKNKLSVLVPFITQPQFDNQNERNTELINLFIKTHPNEGTAYMIAGDIATQQKQFEEARSHYRKAVSLDGSNSMMAWRQILYCNSELKDMESMVSDCEQAISYFPNDALFYYYGAIAAMQLKRYEKAFEFSNSGADVVVENDELLTQLYSTLGDASHYLKKYSTSDSAYRKALKADPNNAYAMNNYAYFLSLRKEKLTEAEALSKRSLELEPNNSSYMDTYGWILFQLGKYTEAEVWINKSLSENAGSSEVLEHYGDVLYKLNRTNEAVTYWIKAKEAGKQNDTLNKKIQDKKWYE